MKALSKKTLEGGKTDLLLRFFESQWFNEWIALQYLYQNPQPGVEDYLCNKLYEMPEQAVEKYLLQLVYLAVSRPGCALEKTIVDICSKSFGIAVKVRYFLGQVGNLTVEVFLNASLCAGTLAPSRTDTGQPKEQTY